MATSEAARDEEASRRLWWNFGMRFHGWGDEVSGWVREWADSFCEWGLEDEVESMRREIGDHTAESQNTHTQSSEVDDESLPSTQSPEVNEDDIPLMMLIGSPPDAD
jgi:hypothetical protein